MQKIVQTVVLAYNNLPRPHRLMLGSLTLITLAVAAWRPIAHHPEKKPIININVLEPAQVSPLLPEASEPIEAAQSSQVDDIPHDDLDQKVTGEDGMHEYVVSNGDTLGSILIQYGINMSDVALLASQNPDVSNLVIGQQLSWVVNDDGSLQRLVWEISRRETRVYERVGNTFQETRKIQKGEWRNLVLSGQVNGSFVESALTAGLSRSEINAVIKALQWKLDFHKLHKGDRFTVFVSREEFDGQSDQSQLLGVRMNTSGRDHYAIRADDGKFYDRQGEGLSISFLRFPSIKPFRVSSHFNPHRVNPVTGRVAPHKGVDFAMPVGTPVLAVSDGEVVSAKYSGAAGNYIVIRHGHQYTTRYMHLKKLLVTTGQKVKRGDRIALSGNTGRSTGAHLHYELWSNQQPVNPMVAKLPYSEGLSGANRVEFLAKVQEIVPQLELN